MKKAFTLIELLVVIGIIAILSGIAIASLSGSSDSAKAAKCLANMKNLALAAQSYGVDANHYPHAGSVEYMYTDSSRGKRNTRVKYNESKGWISWASQGQYPSESKAGAASIPMCTDDDKLALYALTNGALWKYIGGSVSSYVCPVHQKKVSLARWSYLMNAYFGWSSSEGYAYSSYHHGIQYGTLKGAERILLFSEVPFQGPGMWFPDGTGSSTDSDAILQYKGCKSAPSVAGPGRRDGNEHIGANHKSGRNWFAHVVFADGHVEKLRCSSSSGASINADNLIELTTWLCTGEAVGFNGKRYDKLD